MAHFPKPFYREPLVRFARCAQRAFRWAADEYAAMLEVIKEPNLRDLIVKAWETGARPRELRIVEAQFVDLGDGRWVLPKKQAKGKKRPRAVYLNDAALKITRRRLAANPTGYLFTNPDGEPWTRWGINCAFDRLRIADLLPEG